MDNKGFLGKRRDRAIAIILSYKEDACDFYLPEDISKELREVILENINDVCDLAFDLMDDHMDINQYFLDKLEEIYSNGTGKS